MNGRSTDLIGNESGYQKLKLILSDMGERKCKKIELEYEILLKFFQEIQSLKIQKNVLLDKVDELKVIAESKQSKELDQDAQSFLIIIDILRYLKTRGQWIEYKNKTVHTKEFYRIEKEIMEKIVDEKANGFADSKKILDMMANMGIIRKQDNKILSTATVEGVPKRIYMIRIDSIDSIDLLE